MTSYRTVIVDDEPLARRNLKSLLKAHPDFDLVAECRSGAEAVALINSQSVDVLFLDIQMPEMDGFRVIESLDTDHCPVIVFVTAYDEFAIKAFDVSAADYLLKPVDQARFEQALSKARRLLDNHDAAGITKRLAALLASHDQQKNGYAKRLLIKNGSRIYFLSVDEIDHIEASDYYSALHVGPKVHLIRESMKELESRLDPAVFVRIHRSAIVNARRVKELRHQPTGSFTVHLEGGATLKMSRTRYEQVQELLLR